MREYSQFMGTVKQQTEDKLMSNFKGISYARGHAVGAGFGDLVGHAFSQLGTWHERSRQRRQLAALSTHLLKDMGIDHADAAQEAAKPFWRA